MRTEEELRQAWTMRGIDPKKIDKALAGVRQERMGAVHGGGPMSQATADALDKANPPKPQPALRPAGPGGNPYAHLGRAVPHGLEDFGKATLDTFNKTATMGLSNLLTSAAAERANQDARQRLPLPARLASEAIGGVAGAVPGLVLAAGTGGAGPAVVAGRALMPEAASAAGTAARLASTGAAIGGGSAALEEGARAARDAYEGTDSAGNILTRAARAGNVGALVGGGVGLVGSAVPIAKDLISKSLGAQKRAWMDAHGVPMLRPGERMPTQADIGENSRQAMQGALTKLNRDAAARRVGPSARRAELDATPEMQAPADADDLLVTLYEYANKPTHSPGTKAYLNHEVDRLLTAGSTTEAGRFVMSPKALNDYRQSLASAMRKQFGVPGGAVSDEAEPFYGIVASEVHKTPYGEVNKALKQSADIYEDARTTLGLAKRPTSRRMSFESVGAEDIDQVPESEIRQLGQTLSRMGSTASTAGTMGGQARIDAIMELDRTYGLGLADALERNEAMRHQVDTSIHKGNPMGTLIDQTQDIQDDRSRAMSVMDALEKRIPVLRLRQDDAMMARAAPYGHGAQQAAAGVAAAAGLTGRGAANVPMDRPRAADTARVSPAVVDNPILQRLGVPSGAERLRDQQRRDEILRLLREQGKRIKTIEERESP